MTDYDNPKEESAFNSENNSSEQQNVDEINEETLALGEETETQPADPVDVSSNIMDTIDDEVAVEDISDTELALGDETETQPADPVDVSSNIMDTIDDEVDSLNVVSEETANDIEVEAVDNEVVLEEVADDDPALGDETETQPADPVDVSSEIMDTIDEEVITEIPTSDNIFTNGSSAITPEFDVQSYNTNPTSPTDVVAASTVMANKSNVSYTNPNSSTNGVSTMEANKSKDSMEDYQILPEASWPPPMFIRRNVTPQERYYLEQRWHSQWRFFDKKANDSKRLYLRLQRIIVIGSVTVPVLVSLDPDILAGALNTLVSTVNLIPRLTVTPADATFAALLIDATTVVLSLAVAIAAGLESLNKYGDNWGSYRQAAEELQAEKSFYDVSGGRYANNVDAFGRFVERTEEIIAQQNGRFVASVEKQVQESEKRTEEYIDSDNDGDVDTVMTETVHTEASVG